MRRTAEPRRVLAIAILTVAAASPLAAQEWHDFRSARQVGDVGALSVELFYGAGHLNVGATDLPLLYDARLRYDAETFAPVRGWTRDGSDAALRVGVESVASDNEGRARLRIGDDVDFDLENLLDGGEERAGTLELALNRSVETSLQIRVGAAEADLELGGLSLSGLDYATGASDTEISFRTPNRVRMGHMALKSGAARFEATELGNARFDSFEFEGAVGEVLLDFSGEWERDASARVKVVIGELRIRVPREIGVRITRKSLLSSLDAKGFEKRGDAHVTPNWDDASVKLDIELEAGFGTVEVVRR